MLRLLAPAVSIPFLVAPAAAQITFTDVTLQRGIYVPTAPNAGTAIGDVDGDGWQDFVVFGSEDDLRPRIYRNNGELASQGLHPRWFSDVSRFWIPDDAHPSAGGQLIDLDHDGDQDMIVARRYFEPLEGEPNYADTGLEFYRNDGNRFVLDTLDPFLGRDSHRYSGLTLGDTDLDGDLDAIFLHNQASTGGPGFFVRNDGFPTFVDDTAAFGAALGDWNRYFTGVLCDFNKDMLPDLHVAIDFYEDFHCRNLGGGLFQDVSQQVGVTNKGADMGLAVGDIENDGDLDMYSTNINYGVLYVNDGAGNFVNDAPNRGVGGWGANSVIGWSTVFADFDLDRDQDLVFVAYGVGFGRLYENDGTGYFTDVTATSGLVLRGHGMASFDYDRDGDEDLLITKAKQVLLFENDANDLDDRHWLAVEVEGTASNRPGIGTRLEVESPDGLVQVRHVVSGSGYLNGPHLIQHFGLGDTDQVSELKVTWPNGNVDTYGPFAADVRRKVVE